jgi:DNA modification methylase
LLNKNICVDAIITDPPYNISRNHQLGYSNMGRSGMDYGEWDYNFNQVEWLKEISQIVKLGGSVIIFNDWKNLGNIAQALEKQGFIVKDILRWVKLNPMPRNVERRYVNDYELAVWAVNKGGSWTFNKSPHKSYLRPEFKTGIVMGAKRLHPTQKSLELISDLIKIHTNVNDIVLDPFLGSGTTAAAAKMCDRRFIGCDISKHYFKKAIKRLEYDKFALELCWK